MKKIKLTEKDLTDIIAKLLTEQNMASNMGSGFSQKQGSSDTLNKFKSRQNETQDIEELNYYEFKEEDSYDRDIKGSYNRDDTPGGNPEYFYGDGSLDKLRNMVQDDTNEISRDEIISIAVEVYSLLQDNAPAIASRRVEELLYKLGHFKD
tara:strand:+ start:475 stop:927 length:453 start_codon:yes stop_codon:yes gene_type:complete